MVRTIRKPWALALALSVLAGACLTLSGPPAAKSDRGLKFPHKKHADEGMACADCHEMQEGSPVIPQHDFCSTCHDFDLEKPTPEACGFCHTNPENKVAPLPKRLGGDLKFNHVRHVEAKVECASCHADPDKTPYPSGNLMTFCMDCHAKKSAELNDCKVCHEQLDKSVRPTMHGKERIAHDAPLIWKRTHGAEYRKDSAFCEMCHDKEESCEACHRKNPPDDHTVSWRRKSHGMRAQWDRDKCAVCHEEEFCVKCHRSTTPSSHRGGWGEPLNRHCATCHFPPQESGCLVCHESVSHDTAPRSPHATGRYPSNCRMCHPVVPGRAPHTINTTMTCDACH
ncbi:MAG TPA: cytochrome c3 family protein [Candidatus Hydrogenedentes bacterium]|nr:cytochrome c3 family protein [Candidatus Hydrogenedentota bacterium]HRT19962.1 cytochrome c3 family protein [Candidatus Hydrogenedentota bacterium]HRT64640.1 cytochrome c3 family protein [Candidatus Hydrogenedentota bacterium]